MKGIVAIVFIGLIAFSSATQCEDGSQCPGNSTCCIREGGKYGCCSYKNGVCCPDKLNCCPEGFTCTKVPGICIQIGESNGFLSYASLMSTLTPSQVAVENVEDESVKTIEKCLEDIPVFAQIITKLVTDVKAKNKDAIISDIEEAIREGEVVYVDCKDAITARRVKGDDNACISDVQELVNDITTILDDAKAQDFQKLIQDAEKTIQDGQKAVQECQN